MFDQEAKRGAEAAKRRDELLGKYRVRLKAAISSQSPAECRAQVVEARKLFDAARVEQEKLRNAQGAAIDALTQWKAGTDATWSQVETVAEEQLHKIEALLDAEGESST